MSFANKRLGKELAKLQTPNSLPPGIHLIKAEDFKEWQLDIEVLDANPIYQGQVYRLKFKFNQKYPIGTYHARPFVVPILTPAEPPEVTFTQQASPVRPIPMHPHIYSNGIICLDLLGNQGWSPVQNVESVCMSIQSMLTGNTKNERPEGDAAFVASNRRAPRDIDFYYHDNDV